MSRRKRWYQDGVIGVSLLLLVGGGTIFVWEAVTERAALGLCLYDIEQQAEADDHQHGADQHGTDVSLPSEASGQKQGPSEAGNDVGDRTEHRKQPVDSCVGLGSDAATALSRASYDLSFLGYLAALYFGVIGVIGIYLSFSTARDGLMDAGRQAVNPGAGGRGPQS